MLNGSTREWLAGKAKSRIERETWNDGRSHGRRFDRLISRTLGLPTVQRSKLSDCVGDLEGQIRSLGQVPVGALEESWEGQLIHARQSCLSALRAWNDPTASFRAEAFSLLLVTAWNALCIAILQKRNEEWRSTDDLGAPIQTDGTDRAFETRELVARASLKKNTLARGRTFGPGSISATALPTDTFRHSTIS